MITDLVDLEQVLDQYDPGTAILVGPLLRLSISKNRYFFVASQADKICQAATVLVLVPVILLTLVIATGSAVAHVDAVGPTALIATLVIVGLQIGYLAGIAGRHVMLVVRARRLRSTSLTDSLQPHRPVH
jgi:hypothetical protein